ncbi:unnamed protein product, partial [Prorocentrum cordatum]
ASGSAAAREELWWPGGRCFQRSSASSAAADEESCRGERPAFPPLPAGAPAASALSPTSSWVELGLAAPSASATPVPCSPGARSASAAAPSEASHCAGAAGRGAAGPLRASLVAWMDPFGGGEDRGRHACGLAADAAEQQGATGHETGPGEPRVAARDRGRAVRGDGDRRPLDRVGLGRRARG